MWVWLLLGHSRTLLSVDYEFSCRVSTTGPVTPASRLFSRHVVVFTPLAATAVGLLAVCLMALWEYYERRKMQEFIVSNSVRIGKNVMMQWVR